NAHTQAPNARLDSGMTPPRGRGGRGRGRERGRGRGGRGSQGRRAGSRPESNPENQELYTDVDRFHMQQDKIKFGGGAGDSSSDSDDLDGSEDEEGVMNLDGAGGGSSDDDDDDESEEDDSDASELPELPEHVRRAAMQASSDDDDDDSDGDGSGGGKFGAGGWGKNRSSYYNADTADLEIGQEFEDAEAEEEAALEL
ncbi:unnamed protein product, partial [Ectocarpus sp. 4 AP-2014]